MSLETRYKERNANLQQRVKREMEYVRIGQSKKNYVQLSYILEELTKMMNNKGLVLGYPKILVDSWDFYDELGLELLDLAELYKSWK